MIGLYEFKAPAACVIASVGVLIYGSPILALTYVILALGVYTYLNK